MDVVVPVAGPHDLLYRRFTCHDVEKSVVRKFLPRFVLHAMGVSKGVQTYCTVIYCSKRIIRRYRYGFSKFSPVVCLVSGSLPIAAGHSGHSRIRRSDRRASGVCREW